jgi:aspartate/methionine/tyrosine aminotransferase
MPQGAMYMMVGLDLQRFPQFPTEIQFVEQLVTEESVFCLPGKVCYIDSKLFSSYFNFLCGFPLKIVDFFSSKNMKAF